jgi:hypothetical protein
VCSVASRELSIYRIEQGLRGSGKVDHGAASPASGRARRGGGSVLRLLAMLLAATAWSGRAWLGRIASRHVAAVAGSSSPFTAAAVQGLVVAMSGGVVVAW